MSLRRALVPLVALCSVFMLRANPQRADACAMVLRSTARAMPLVTGEESLIVWDWSTRTEHFVRRLDFTQIREGFGFIVPTPSRPTLHEEDERVFDRLANAYTRRPPASNARARGVGGGPRASNAALPQTVQVVHQQRVAGMDATIVRSDSAAALGQWLGQNGFDNRPAFVEWLRRYTGGTWHVTAFRFAPTAQDALSAKVVRLSFTAQQPYYPYGEPNDQVGVRRTSRPFRLTVISNERVSAMRGRSPWSARVAYAERRDVSEFASAFLTAQQCTSAWLTTFDEPNSLRNSDDLLFSRARAQSAVAPSIPGVFGPRRTNADGVLDL